MFYAKNCVILPFLIKTCLTSVCHWNYDISIISSLLERQSLLASGVQVPDRRILAFGKLYSDNKTAH